MPHLKQIFFILFSALFLFSHLSFSKESESELESTKEKDRAILFLKKTLKKYQSQSIHFKIEKQLFLPSIEETIKEVGDFYIEKQKFQLKIRGTPSYLMIFNGEHLWYQSDTKEKIVFKLKEHPQINLFFRLFNPDSFFNHFTIQRFTKKNSKVYSFHLKTMQNIQGVGEIFMEVGNYIQEIKIVWNDLGQWQRYKFLNPWVKKSFSKSKFQFTEKGFEVISNQKL